MPAAMTMTLEQLAKAFTDAGAQLPSDFTKPLKVAKQMIVADVQENFQGGHDPDRNPWLPLRRPRPKRKGQKAGTDQPLLDTGVMRRSVTGNGPGHVESLTATSLTIGTNLDRAGIHNFGGTINQPARTRVKPWVFRSGGGDLIFTRRIRAHSVKVPRRQFLGIGKLQTDLDDLFGEFMADNCLPF